MHHPHIVNRTLEFIGDDLAERGGDPLTDRIAAGIKHHFAGVVDFDPSVFPWPNATGLDKATDPEADGATLAFTGLDPFLPLIIADGVERPIHLRQKIPGVVNHVMKRVFT